ncbi:hypothetical protein TRFO_15858 [Tritrichomonas foetus]|uniref:Uncharacterized protein n=1 Tax=Tritrichomonas foetus TaxID=1144522 RepID=A0A1J4KVS8_9EUKA|nr:hypothetical protein TRFO_15858 [Tritrichomonas foetus]|eukprot:OHT13852.1 hypothetical protein TRFO_15858 [Tritrichomonas foetus]
MLNSDDISIDEINNLLKCFKSFEKFVQKQYDNKNIISNIFVFYIIPLNNIFAKPLPIYYIEHSQGNADDKVIRDIYEMIDLLRHPTLKLNLHFLALDGDLKYKGFHDTFIHDWMSNFNQAKNLFNSSHMLFHVICDPNHVLKRLRYRFVNHVKLAWTSKSKQYGTFDIRNFFDVPEKVLSNKSSTKMDDFFPKELFKKKNLATLYDYEIWDLFSFFMICASLNIAVHENTPRYTVLMMLSISAEFLLIYRRFLNGKKSEHIPYFKNNSIISINGTTYPNYEKSAKTQNTKQSNETKQPRTIDIKNQIIATTFLDKPLIDHLLNDIVSLISALGTVESSFSMIEYGTMLLEHYFGRVRLGCRYNYEIEKIIEVIDRLIIIDHMNLNNPDLTNTVNSRNYEFACVEEGSNQLVKEDVLKCRQIALQLWKNIDSSVLLHDEEILLESFSFDFKSLIDDIYDLDSLIEKHKLSPPRQSRSTNETRLLKQNNQTIVRRYSNSGYGKMKK